VGKLGKNMHKLAVLANGKIGKNLRQISWRQEVTEFPLQKTVLFPGKYKDSRCSSQLRAQHRLAWASQHDLLSFHRGLAYGGAQKKPTDLSEKAEH